jgi:phage regulator Rha-like protein
MVGTWKLSKGTGIDHKSVKRLIKKFNTDFTDIGNGDEKMEVASIILVLKTKKTQAITVISNDHNSSKKMKRSRGRPVEEYLLTEPQAMFLMTLLKNNDVVRDFKKTLTREFFRQRRLPLSHPLLQDSFNHGDFLLQLRSFPIDASYPGHQPADQSRK